MTLCFDANAQPHVLKSIKRDETDRLAALHDILKKCQSIISYEIIDEDPKCYLVMPLMPVALDRFPGKWLFIFLTLSVSLSLSACLSFVRFSSSFLAASFAFVPFLSRLMSSWYTRWGGSRAFLETNERSIEAVAQAQPRTHGREARQHLHQVGR